MNESKKNRSPRIKYKDSQYRKKNIVFKKSKANNAKLTEPKRRVVSETVVPVDQQLPSPKEYLEELENKVIVIYPNKLESLVSLKNAIGNEDVTDCFDDEDREWVNQELEKLWKEYTLLYKEWKT